MSAKSTKPSKKKPAIDRPFDAKVLERACKIAADYQIILQFDDDEYFGRGLELPYVMGDGKTLDECVANTREAFVAVVATMLEAGATPPSPAREQARSEQINVRVTAQEKLQLEEAARRKGFRGIGDYVRSVSLARLS
jgi:predicted RNase H-like HicB family nuclease